MSFSQYDVIVVGAGAAGLSAAIGLARGGFSVIVVEAASYPGAENWSGCVYFCENLAHPDLLGSERVETLAWERRLVERGIFATDGYSLLGMTYRDPKAFRHCYTVLRPVYDHHLAQAALRHSVTILTDTTVESLIRDGSPSSPSRCPGTLPRSGGEGSTMLPHGQGRVIGVCTQRGPLYADLVFLAEGDASHLVTREGYERFADPRETPKFLQGIKQVIDMPEGAIESIFGLGADEGAAYEILIRNGSLRGRDLHLNMGGFIYTNRQSLSIGLVLPVDNLRQDFAGDPNLLLEWFENLPALKPWLREGKRGVFGAKIIRGGGAKDIPTLVDNGLAIGGAASGIGIDFPFPNFTGPATAMGLLLAQAARRIREQGGDYSRENLTKHYLEPLQRTHYWQDVEFLRRWPGYAKRTEAFFGLNLDLALGTAYVWTRPRRWFPAKWLNWLRLLLNVAGPSQWRLLRQDARHLIRSARLQEVIDRPSWGRLLLDGTVNAFRDLAGRPRPNLPQAGKLRVHYSVAGGAEPTGPPSRLLQRWFRRFAPVLGAAAQRVYTNDDVPLREKLPDAIRLLVRQINLADVFLAIGVGLTASFTGVVLAGWNRFLKLIRLSRSGKPPRGIYKRYALAARQVADLTPMMAPASQRWEERLAGLTYQSVKDSHIHLLWPRSLPDKNAVKENGLWHVCPAHVYDSRVSSDGQVQVIVNFENCIKCETCWRGSDLVDWARDGRHRFNYAVHTPAIARLVEAVHAAATSRPAPARIDDAWEASVRRLAEILKTEPISLSSEGQAALAEAHQILEQLDSKLQEFDEALSQEPRTIDRARSEYLEMLARYAQQLAHRLVEIFRAHPPIDRLTSSQAMVLREIANVAGELLAKAEERSRRTWSQHFSWAAADGRQIRFHHLAGLRQYLKVLRKSETSATDETRIKHGPVSLFDPCFIRTYPAIPISNSDWLRAEIDAESLTDEQRRWSARLDAAFPPGFGHDWERQIPLTSEQDTVLRELIAQVPTIDPGDLTKTIHPPLRKMLLAELGRRDPSLAFRVASHLWARDLVRLEAPAWQRHSDHWDRGLQWTCLAVMEVVSESSQTSWLAESFLVPAASAQSIVLLWKDQLGIASPNNSALSIAPLRTLGLRGAGLQRIRLIKMDGLENPIPVDGERLRRIYAILSSADLISIAWGMADQLCRRAIAHASGRVQFPGLFHDEESRDTIGKFGAVKKMLAEMAARRFVIETLDHVLSPRDVSAASEERAGLLKALAAECLGTKPGSIAYNAGQIFGGTGYSEDDSLSKYYRDASAWRFLGLENTDVYRRHGNDLVNRSRTDLSLPSEFAHESQLVDQISQRKALQAELDETLNARSRLQSRIDEWHKAAGDQRRPSTMSAEMEEVFGRWDAERLASKALLLRVHARLESGLPNQLEISLLRVWLGQTSASQDDSELRIQRLLTNPHPDHRPIVHPAAGSPVTSYADYLETSVPYDSGDFLILPVNPGQPRLLPELVEVDPALAESDSRIRTLLTEQFGKPRQAHGPPPVGFQNYERYIEHQHRPDQADLDFCRQHGFFRMTIRKDLGGEGRPKIDYYLLTTNAQRLADVALALTIQVNTSIGTTPVMLARDKDLPRGLKDLEGFLGEPSLRNQIQAGLEKLLLGPSTDLQHFGESFGNLQNLLAKAIFSRTVLRSLFHRFGEEWSQAEKAGKDFDRPALQTHLQAALQAWMDTCERAGEYRDELERRRRACDLFLQWISSGQISAFALTEPSAGSDTARLATRARLRSVPVEEQADGSFRFVPADGKESRVLLDAERLQFPNRVPQYRWSAEQTAPIRFDEYDYETDRPDRQRYYQANGKKVYFTDIGQLRRREGRLWYDYWELTGAKMWITNGRMSGVMCLYAKTEEGITGFMVDRHAEGLIVGKDEAKMGQCGSPTNELALQAVRVPRENVIGLEGRGQVNALESLNVGRAALAMSAMASMADLIHSSRDFAQRTYGEIPPWVDWRLQQMEEIRFSAEALAFEIVGRFEHPGTRSLRMESAIAKMLGSELLHEVIEYAEDIHGPAGQTELYLVEKRKRDARVLSIYEGTNEIQRFFILKDLAGEVARPWAQSTSPLSPHLGREALELEALKFQFRQRLDSVLELFGEQLWKNPNLQANCFLLSEAVAWLKGADSTLARVAWIDLRQRIEDPNPKSEIRNPKQIRNLQLEIPNEGEDRVSDIGVSGLGFVSDFGFGISDFSVGRRALARCYGEIAHRLKRFDEELMHLRRGYYAPEIRAASLLFQEEKAARSAPAIVSRFTHPLSILVVMEPTAAGIPRPQVSHGRLLEPFLPLSESSRSALEAALRIRDQGETTGGSVTIHVVGVGARGLASVLREPLSLGVGRVRLILPDAEAVTPASAAAALVAVLGSDPGFDLILGGEEGDDQEEGLLVRLLAQGLNIPFAESASQVVIRNSMQTAQTTRMAGNDFEVLLADSAGQSQRLRALPAAVAVKKGLPLREFTTVGYLSALGKNVELIRWPKKVESQPVELVEGLQPPTIVTPSQNAAGPLAPDQAANHLLQELGLGRMSAPSVAFQESIKDVTEPTLLGIDQSRVIGIIASDSAGRLQPSAASVLKAVRLLAATRGAAPVTLLMAPPDESVQRRAIAQCLKWSNWDLLLLSAATEASAGLRRGQMLIGCWPDRAVSPRAIVGESWTESALAALSVRQRNAGLPALRIRQIQLDQGRIILVSSRAKGKLRTRLPFDPQGGVTPWITLTSEAEIQDGDEIVLPSAGAKRQVRVQRWSISQVPDGQLEAGRLLDEVKQEAGVARLAEADFIIDVGFGVGNRDGYEAVVEPLVQALREIGVRNLAIGGSRKVTEELHLLPPDRQIGQSGVSVNPQILLAIGISGAPQHLNYIGSRATILAFNRDPEAPLMTLNQRQPRPRVFPIIGDLFETVPAFIKSLRNEVPADLPKQAQSVGK